MTNDDYRKGEEDAISGTIASRFTEDYVNGFFSGLQKTNPLFRELDDSSFRDGFFGRNSGESHDSSYLAGQMVRKKAVVPSNLEKKVDSNYLAQRTGEEKDPELDRINEQRWEYDLPTTTRRELRERAAEHMLEQYGYDIYK